MSETFSRANKPADDMKILSQAQNKFISRKNESGIFGPTVGRCSAVIDFYAAKARFCVTGSEIYINLFAPLLPVCRLIKDFLLRRVQQRVDCPT